MKRIVQIFALTLLLSAVNNIFVQNEKIVRGGVLNGRAINMPKPDYPQEAKDLCIEGQVVVEVLVGEKGEVIEAEAVSGDEFLRGASVEAAKKVKFNQTPHILVKVKGNLVYNFILPTKCLKVGVVNKKAVSLPKPKGANLNHPKNLRITEEQIVAVQIAINIEGKVTAVRAISGHPLLQSACVVSTRQAKFAPLILNGPPIKIKALLVYKFKPDGTIDTNIESDDKSVIGTPVNLVKPPPPFCNCKLSGNVLVEAKTDEQGNVVEAKAISGHPILKNLSEKAALQSKFLPTNIKAKILIQYNFEAADESAREVNLKNIEIKEVKIEK